MIPRRLQEGIEILKMLGEDTDKMLRPIRKAESLEANRKDIKFAIRQNAGHWKYLTPQEQDEYIRTFGK